MLVFRVFLVMVSNVSLGSGAFPAVRRYNLIPLTCVLMAIFPDIASLQYGSSWSGVVNTLVVFEDGGILGKANFEGGHTILVKGITDRNVPTTFVILEAKVVQVSPMVICEVGESSSYFPGGPQHATQMMRVVELCSGIGVFSHMATYVGLKPALGVDHNQRWANLYAKLHECEFAVGECDDPAIVRKMLACGLQGCILLAGISCQPHSRAGDKLGMADPRARSLPQVLKVAWLLGAPIFVLECVPEIQANATVQKILSDFASKTGMQVSQQILRLSDSWCTRRDRWFAVFSLKSFPIIAIPAMPQQEQFRRIEQVMPKVMNMGPQELQHLQLSLYELSKFHEFGCGGISKLMINPQGVLPTCLHSAGNQLYPCRCGCHQGFSLQRLQSKGLYGTLIGLGQTVFHNGINMEHCRYLHPHEMFLLHGGLPTNWGDDLKLALAGIGQCVAPLQGLWVLLHVKHVINGLLQLPAFVPEEAFRQYVDTVVSNKHQGFPSTSNVNVLQQQSVSSECTWHDHQVDAVSTAVLPRDATVRQFKDAECKLQFHLLGAIPGQGVFPDSLVVDAQGKSLDDTEQLSQRPGFSVGIKRKRSQPEEHLDCPCEEWDVSEQPCHEGKDISPTLPFTVVDHGLSALDGFRNRAFLEVACPRIQAFDDLAVSLCPAIGKEARIDLLQRQGEVWADDEIRAHLRQIVCQGPPEQNLVAWDPLVVTSIIMFGHFEVIDEMVAKLPNGATVITALIIEKHWYPIMWRLEGVQAWAFTCGHAWGFSVAINKLHQRVCHALSCQLSAVRFHSLAFRVETCCGAMSILYLHHLIWGSDLPVSLPQLQEKHRSLRHALIGFLSGSELYPRPWIWGLGEGTWFSSLQEILVEHGVKACDAEARAKLVVEKLGEKQVLAALKSQASWKELKWYASQCIPMFQIIRPSELNDVIEARAQSGKPIGNRSQKKHGKGQGKGKGKGKSSDRQVVDPKGLRVEEGLFQCGENLAVSQITMQQVGPQASGIVVCTRDEALPFLMTGRINSTGGLALIIVDHVDVPPTTTLLAERVRFPAICLANSEPILVDGLMFQLGAQSVVRKVAPPKFELVSVATCVIKFMVFRDQVPVSWDVVSAHPLKFLFSKIPLLQKCNTVGCGAGCGHWHPEQVDDVEEPILEVWGRQFMLQSFKPMPASEAEVFGVHLRLPAKLELPLQGFSGLDGVYLEPKEIDGKRPSTSFQVFWQQKATYQDIVHLRQITANALGIARMAGKYGIRCQTCHGEGVNATIRPGGSYLPQGKKSLYLMGPVPFGTLKTSVSQILDLLSWAARPMHPVPTAAHIDGVMWKLQAVNPPPQAFVVTDHGELLITRIDEPEHRIAPSASLLGASHTVSLVTSGSSTDPLQLNDPWEQHRSGVSSVAAASISVSDPVEVLEKKVMDAVVAKIGINNMEVDQAEIHRAKVASLEQKVSELQASQSQLHAMVVEQGNRQQTQISALQTQGDRLEVTVHESTCQLESFQEQFQNQIQKQQGQLDALFQQQMDRIESLFQKKARTS